MSKNLRQLKDQVSELEAQRLAVLGTTKKLTPKRKELEIENLQRELKIANEKIRAIERAKANNVHS